MSGEKSFWQGWIEAPDDVERLKMVRSLPPFRRGGICRYMTVTLMDSYLRDLLKEMKRLKHIPFDEEKIIERDVDHVHCDVCGAMLKPGEVCTQSHHVKEIADARE